MVPSVTCNLLDDAMIPYKTIFQQKKKQQQQIPITMFYACKKQLALPAFAMGGNVIPHCTQYTYLGAPVRITPAIPACQRIHPFVKSLLDRLEPHFAPVKWLANNAAGVSIPVARTLYILLLRSVVDYLSPALCQLPRPALEPLEKFQNR
ncbi:hypothetical protein SK128_005660, partial [Halocaridina rubra]